MFVPIVRRPRVSRHLVRYAATSAKVHATPQQEWNLFQPGPILPSPLPPSYFPSSSSLSKSATLSPTTQGPFSSRKKVNADVSPLPDDRLRALFTNDLLYPASQAVEQLAVLRTSIDAGLALRAGKLFDLLYSENLSRFTRLTELDTPSILPTTSAFSTSARLTHAHLLSSTRLPKDLWDDLIQLFLFRAAQQSDTSVKAQYFSRAQTLAEYMIKSASLHDLRSAGVEPFEPAVDATTGAILVRGYAHVLQSWPLNWRLQQSARDLLVTLSRVGVSLSSMAHSEYWYLSAPPYQSESNVEWLDRSAAMGLVLHNAESDERLATQVLEMAVVLDRLEAKDREAAASSDATEGTSSNDTGAEVLGGSGERKPEPEEELPLIEPTLTSGGSKYFEGMTLAQHSDPSLSATPLNLAMLKQNLSAIDDARSRFTDPYKRQKWLEDSALEAARKRLRVANETLGAATKNAMDMGDRQIQLWMWDWFSSLHTELKQVVTGIKDGLSPCRGVDPSLQPLLKVLSAERLALIPVLELMHLLGSGHTEGVPVSKACLSIGKSIEKEYHAASAKRRERVARTEAKNGTAAIDRSTLSLMQQDFTSPSVRSELKELARERDAVWVTPRWSNAQRIKMGSFLVDVLTRVAMLRRSAKARDESVWNQALPAFYTSYQYLSGKRTGVIKLNNYVLERLDQASLAEVLHPRQLPMLVPPRPWVSHDSGGYFTERKTVMRLKDSTEQGSYLRAASESGELDKVLSSLDVLGQTAWRVNTRVLQVVTSVWNSGEGIGDIPPRLLNLEIPAKPEDYDTNLRSRYTYNRVLASVTAATQANHSQRCDTNYKLEIARAYAKDRFYFPHNIDFRGRAYPIPPNFNHMGNDLCRGLLKFDTKKKLGTTGLRWLRIHVANVFGFDKASLTDREKWTLDHWESVRDSAENPLGGQRWWLGADDPWQCLAACIELNEAMAYPGGPEAYPSSLPVHQDGTCNGLQHYAALGGDLRGAQQVNLAQGDKPADVYTGVAELVISQLALDAEQGNELAKLLQDKITRKVVKQTVMTTVYGVTFVGAKAQIKKQLVDKEVPSDQLWSASHYLAKVTLTKIGHLFSGATRIQRWLHLCARLIAKSIPPERIVDADSVDGGATTTTQNKKDAISKKGKEQMTSVIWTTALGLPVVQPYRRHKKRQMDTKLQSIFINDPSVNHEVSPKKQASAFPPNFVHSLDATHMMMTALEAHRASLTFASVHDSYWTHASEVDTLSDLIRETFVLLHSNDILKNLRQEFLDRFGEQVVWTKDIETCVEELEQAYGGALPLQLATLPRRKAGRGEAPSDGLVVAEKVASSSSLPSPSSSSPASNDPTSDSSTPPTESTESDSHITTSSDSDEPLQGTALTALPPHERPVYLPLKSLFPPLPPKGDFDVKEIRRSLYFFS